MRHALKNFHHVLVATMLEGLSLEQGKRLLEQASPLRLESKVPESKNKFYALHELEVDCISKGKAHKCYEFDTKICIVCSQKEGFVLAVKLPGQFL